MSKEWTGSVRIDAPPAAVYDYLADFGNSPDWDTNTVRIEQTKPGDAAGVGAEYRAYERLNMLVKMGDGKSFLKDQAGLADRDVCELVPNRRIAWHAHPVPRMLVTLDCAFELEPDGDATRLSETVRLNSFGVVDAVQRVVLPNLQGRQQAQWQANLERIKERVEQRVANAVPEPVLAAR